MAEILHPPTSGQAPSHGDQTALLDVQAVARLLHCSPRHVYRLCDSGRMPPPMKLGALVRWSRQHIEEWIAGGCKPVRQTNPV